jgi:hypothetical protein
LTTGPAEHVTAATPPGDLDDPGAADLVTGTGLGAEEEGPDDAAMRAELRARGHLPPKRGRLGADWVALWASGEGAEFVFGRQDQGAGNIPGDIPADDGGVSDADFIGDHARQVTAETRPRQPKAEGWRARLGATGKGKGKRRSGKESTGPRQAAPKHARVPLDRLGESAFGALARATRTADPILSRTFALEAPIAGPMIEDALSGTIADRALQPLARAQAKGSILVALFGMPLGVLALEQAQTLPDKQRATREAIILPMLREAAVTWVEFAGPAIKRKMDRDAERGPLYEEADALLAYLFYGEPAQAEPSPGEGLGEEDQAAAAAQHQAAPGFMGFGAPPQQSQYANPYPAAQLVPRR